MTSRTLSGTDSSIQSAVESELGWAPDVDAAGIGVSVERGAVTLHGDVDSYSEMRDAVRSAFRVTGVTTVTNDLVVRPTARLWGVPDSDLAQDIEKAIAWLAGPPNSVRAEVARHRVILTGEVQWNYERVQVERAVERITGVSDVDNRITLAQRASAADTAERITDALARNAALDAKRIRVTSRGNTVRLAGTVHSWSERETAESAAWSSPHVTVVDNQLVIRTF